jgi:hypothetical protein
MTILNFTWVEQHAERRRPPGSNSIERERELTSTVNIKIPTGVGSGGGGRSAGQWNAWGRSCSPECVAPAE